MAATNTRIYKSLYPPVPSLPTPNHYDFLLHRPDQDAWPDYTVYINGLTGDRMRFSAFKARVDAAAVAIIARANRGGLSILPGADERIGVLCENCIDFAVLVIALLKLALPAILLPSSSPAAEVCTLARTSGVTRIFTSPRLLSTARATGLPDRQIYVMNGRVRRMSSLDEAIERVKVHGFNMPSQKVTDETLAYMVFSSGTSGLPKGVMTSHKNLFASAMAAVTLMSEVKKVYSPKPPDNEEGVPISIVATPLYHAMGLHNGILRHFLTPQTAVVIPKWDVDLYVQLAAKYRINSMSIVPAQAHQLANHKAFGEMDLSSLRTVGYGAAHTPDELRMRLTRRMKLDWIVEGYGLSECTLAAVGVPFNGILSGRVPTWVPGMTGILLPGMEARIVREDGSDAEVDESGEIYLRGGNVVLGYWNNETATRDAFLPGGWLRTGDRFRTDAEGRFFYVDRMKDTLKVSGVQVSPSEIEIVLLEHPARLISDVSVAGVPGARMSDEKVPRAWIVLSEAGKKRGADKVVHELDAWVKKRLSKPKWVRGGFSVVNEATSFQIPKSPTGKVLRRVLQDRDRGQKK
ncbi:acetyl-CoA synthetase-like protein, partial [Peniophora sp. CONT]